MRWKVCAYERVCSSVRDREEGSERERKIVRERGR